MALDSNSVSLLFKAKGDTDDAKRAFKDLEGSIGKSTGAIAGLSSALPIAGAALAAMAAGIAVAVTGLYNLTKSAAAYAGEIEAAMNKTGLAAPTLAALKYQAEMAGTSLDAVTGATAKFAKTLGEAQAGNQKAQANLKDLGVTTYDLDTALGQATKSIAEADAGTQQIVLSQKAFGKSGADLIDFLSSFSGDLQKATKEAERLGLVISEKDARAAAEFEDALFTLSAQVQVAAVAFTSELMPILTDFFTSTTEWYARNKNDVRSWGTMTADIVRGVAASFRDATAAISDFMAESRAFGSSPFSAGGASQVPMSAYILGAGGMYFLAKGEQEREGQPLSSGLGGRVNIGGGGARSTPKGGGGGSKPKSAGGDPNAELKADLSDQLTLLQSELRKAEKLYKDSLTRLHEHFREFSDEDALSLGVKDASQAFLDSSSRVLAELRRVEAEKAALEKETENQKKIREQKAADGTAEIANKIFEEQEKVNDKIFDARLKLANDLIQIEEDLTARLIAINEESTERHIQNELEAWEELIANEVGNWEAQNRLRGEAINALTLILNTEQARRLAFLEDQKQAEREDIDRRVKDEAKKLKLLAELDELYKLKALKTAEEFERRKKEIEGGFAVPVGDEEEEDKGSPLFGLMGPLEELGNMAKGAFASFSQGLGQIISDWVLLGEVGPDAMRKMTASVLAGLAAQAAVKSLFYLAEGIAALFWNPLAAAGYFTAAAIMGGIAGGAALAGRAIAGDAFRRESTGAFGGAGSPGRTSGAGNGQVFSSQENQIIETSRNNPGGRGILGRLQSEITLKIESTSAHIVDVVKKNIQTNGHLRTVIQDAT